MVKSFKNLQLQNQMVLQHSMMHWVLLYHQDCSNDDLVLTLTYFTSQSTMENANTKDFMESLENFGLKLVIRVVLMSK